jgi:hypothetical protein
MSKSLLGSILVITVFSAACGSTSQTTAASPAHLASPSSVPSSSSSRLAALPCRLPVIKVYLAGEPPGGWLTPPLGTFLRDPASSGVDSTNVVSWDQAVGRWVPADARSVSPDGKSYFVMSQGSFKIVDAATRTTIKQVLHTGAFPNQVVGFTSQGVYLRAAGIESPPGLWRFDATTGQLTQISSASGFWEVVGESTAWGTSASSPSTVRVLDLQTGVGSDVFTSRHKGVTVAGYVGLRVLIVEGDDVRTPIIVTILRADGSTQPVAVPSDWSRIRSAMETPVIPTGYAQDGPRIWFFGDGFGLAEFDLTYGLRLVALTLPPPRMGVPDTFFAAGGCVPS